MTKKPELKSPEGTTTCNTCGSLIYPHHGGNCAACPLLAHATKLSRHARLLKTIEDSITSECDEDPENTDLELGSEMCEALRVARTSLKEEAASYRAIAKKIVKGV